MRGRPQGPLESARSTAPQRLTVLIRQVEEAPFLDEEQRRDIMCRNALRFFRFAATPCDP